MPWSNKEKVVVPESRVFHTLDALRGIAAIGVLVFHMAPAFTPIAAPGGYLAVDLFFMMSGVVLSHAYEGRFRSGMGTIDFMRVRLIRLYPLYLAATVFAILVAVASLRGRNSLHWDSSSLSSEAARALFFLPNFSGRPVNEIFPLNIPCWSLFFEILVNFLFVVFWRLLTSRRLIVVSFLTGIAVGAAIASTGTLDQGSTPASFAIGLVRTLFGFSVGVLIARRVPREPHGHSNLGVLAIAAVVGIAIAGGPPQQFRAIWDAIFALAVFPLLVYFGTRIDPGSNMRRISTFLGVTSYAIYVFHSPLSAVLNSTTHAFASGAGAPYMGVAVLALFLAGCWLIDRYVDMPIRTRLGRFIPKMG